ncbi:MAG: hypothetical protein RR533_06185, partial [Carnobacterium sp.]
FPIKSIHKYMDLESVALDFKEIDKIILSNLDNIKDEKEVQETAYDRFNEQELISINEVFREFFVNVTSDNLKKMDYNCSNEDICKKLMKLVTDPKQSKVIADLVTDDYKGFSVTKFKNQFTSKFHEIFTLKDTEKTSPLVSAATSETVATRTEESITVETETVIKDSDSEFYLTKEIYGDSHFNNFRSVYKITSDEIFLSKEKISENEMLEEIRRNQFPLLKLFEKNLFDYKNSNNTK